MEKVERSRKANLSPVYDSPCTLYQLHFVMPDAAVIVNDLPSRSDCNVS